MSLLYNKKLSNFKLISILHSLQHIILNMDQNNAGKLKILQVNKSYYPWVGGIETIIRQLSEGLQDETKLKVLSCQRKGGTTREIVHGVEVYRASSFGVVASVPISVSFFFLFKKLSKNADIVQFHAPFPLGDLACLLSGYKGKVVIWWHSDVVKQKKALIFYKPIMKRFLKRADLILVSSEGVAKGSHYLGPYMNKCKVIHFGCEKQKDRAGQRYLEIHGFDRHVVESISYKQNITNDDELFKEDICDKQEPIENVKKPIEFLFEGRLIYYKGVSFLIEAFAKVKGNVHLTLVGAGKLEAELKEKVQELGIEDKVTFAGFVPDEDIPRYFEQADVFVLPSIERSEAFALVQLEAMAYGIPVINTWLQSGVPEVSLDKITGLTVQPSDAGALAEAMQWMVDHPEERVQMGMRGRQRVTDEFSEDKMVEQVYETYQELCAKS